MDDFLNIKKVIVSTSLLFTGLLIGIIGFHISEGYDFLDSLYFTVITMATIGYEIPGGSLSDAGKLLAIFLSIFTMGLFLYAITTLTTFIIEGELQNYFRRKKVTRSIQNLKNHVIVCGLGRNGKEAVIELERQHIPYVAIEGHHDVVAGFQEQFPAALLLEGDATSEDMLIRAHISEAKGVISALPDDAANVFVALTARELNPKLEIVARASHESTITKLRRAGANRVILPNMLAGKRMARVMTKPALSDFIDLITGEGSFNLHLEEVDCLSNSQLVGKDLKSLKLPETTGILVLGIQTVEGIFELNPGVTRVISGNEKIFILGTSEQIGKFRAVYGKD